MAFTVKVEQPTAKPKQRSTRTANEDWRELIPVVDDALKLAADQSLPIVVPDDEIAAVVSGLRKAGAELGVTVRFSTYPVIDPDTGEQAKNDQGKGVVTYAQPAKKGHGRLMFWTVKKIHRPNAKKNAEQPTETAEATDE